MVIGSIRALGILVRACERNLRIISISYSDDPEYRRDHGLVNTMCIPLPNGYWMVIYSNHDNSVDPFSGEVYDPEAWDEEIIETGTVSSNLMVTNDIIDILLGEWYCEKGKPKYSYAAYGKAPKEFTFADIIR